MEQTINVPVPHVELAVSSGEANTTSAEVTAVAKPAGEARPPGIAKHSASTEPELAACSGEAGHSRSRETGTTSADETTGANPVGEARPPVLAKCRATTTSASAQSVGVPRPPEIAKHTATTKSELAVMDDARPLGIAKYGASLSAAVAKPVGETRPPGFATHSATRELAEFSDRAQRSWSKEIGTTSTDVRAVTKTVGEARPPEFVEHSATSESELADSSDEESSGETGPLWSRASGTSSTAPTATVAKSVDDDQPPGIAKCNATQNVGVAVSLLTLLEQAELRMLRQFAAGYRHEAA